HHFRELEVLAGDAQGLETADAGLFDAQQHGVDVLAHQHRQSGFTTCRPQYSVLRLEDRGHGLTPGVILIDDEDRAGAGGHWGAIVCALRLGSCLASLGTNLAQGGPDRPDRPDGPERPDGPGDLNDPIRPDRPDPTRPTRSDLTDPIRPVLTPQRG